MAQSMIAMELRSNVFTVGYYFLNLFKKLRFRLLDKSTTNVAIERKWRILEKLEFRVCCFSTSIYDLLVEHCRAGTKGI